MENMIEDVLKDIREAEKLADDLEKQAYQDGKNAVLSAEAEAQRQLALTKESVKDANDLAAERRKVILKKGEEAASELAEQKNSVIEETADKLVEILLEKYS